MFESNLDYANVHKVMVNHLYNYIVNNKLRAAVLGISGGIDSTVVAYMLNEVKQKLDEEKYPFYFVGLSMPTETTDKDEFRISELVGHAFCKDFRVLDITNESQSITVPHIGSGVYMTLNDKIRLGNVKSRLRMIHLYDIAKAYGGIVIGTDNKTEKELGFSTIGGDALFDFCPIQHLWKTEVYGLAQYYKEREIKMCNWEKVYALVESINIPPQAGLGISLTDMGEIGAPDYYAVDTVLYNDENGLPQPEHDYVEAILNRKRENAYKKNLPIITPRHALEEVMGC